VCDHVGLWVLHGRVEPICLYTFITNQAPSTARRYAFPLWTRSRTRRSH